MRVPWQTPPVTTEPDHEDSPGHAAWPSWLVVTIGLFAFVLARRLTLARIVPDTDWYFHLAVSRRVGGSLWISRIPEIVGLGWDESFPDKELLFHTLSGALYAIGGRGLVEQLPFLLTLAAVAALVWACAAVSTPGSTATAVLAVLLASAWWMRRFDGLRAYALAVVIFVLLAGALLRGRPRLTFLFAVLYPLAYHAVYMPVLLCLVIGGPGAVRSRRARVTLAAGLGGVVLGILAHPAFPENLEIARLVVSVALQDDASFLSTTGVETLPLRGDALLTAFGPLFGVLAAVGVGLAMPSLRRRRPDDESPADAERGAPPPVSSLHFLSLWVLAILLCGLVIKNPRAGEYAVPAVTLLLAAALARARAALPAEGRLAPVARYAGGPVGAALVVALGVGLQLPLWSTHAARPKDEHPVLREGLAAARSLPEGDAALVANVDWPWTPFILWERPGMRFFDTLDPRLLAAANPDLHAAREALRSGVVPDPAALVQDVWGADFALVGTAAGATQLEDDPRFVRLYPPTPDRPGPRVFRVDRAADEAFARELEVQLGDRWELRRVITRDEPRRLSPWIELLAAGDAPTKACGRVRVPAARARESADARWLGVGGGPRVRVFLDGVLYFEGGPYEQPRLLQTLVPLPEEWPASRLEVELCDDEGTAWRRAAALSLWDAASLLAACERQGVAAPELEPAPAAPWRSRPRATCLAPIAVASSTAAAPVEEPAGDAEEAAPGG